MSIRPTHGPTLNPMSILNTMKQLYPNSARSYPKDTMPYPKGPTLNPMSILDTTRQLYPKSATSYPKGTMPYPKGPTSYPKDMSYPKGQMRTSTLPYQHSAYRKLHQAQSGLPTYSRSYAE